MKRYSELWNHMVNVHLESLQHRSLKINGWQDNILGTNWSGYYPEPFCVLALLSNMSHRHCWPLEGSSSCLCARMWSIRIQSFDRIDGIWSRSPKKDNATSLLNNSPSFLCPECGVMGSILTGFVINVQKI